MTTERKYIHVDPESDLGHLLDEAGKASVFLEKNGVVYRLAPEVSSVDEKDYDPDAALAGMRAAGGSWADIDTERFKAFIYRAREEGTRNDGQSSYLVDTDWIIDAIAGIRPAITALEENSANGLVFSHSHIASYVLAAP